MPAFAAMGMLAMASATWSSNATHKRRIDLQAAGNAKEVLVVKRAKQTRVSGPDWEHEVNTELFHSAGLFILPFETAEPRGVW